MYSLKEKFGLRLKELRKSKSLTQEQIAEKVGIEPVNISKIERGMHFPQPDKIEKLASALDIDIKELFNFGHIQDRQELVISIIESLNHLGIKEIEMVYKFISILKLYK